MKLYSILGFGLGLGVTAAVLAAPASLGDRLAVHEWGTFTVLQDEEGHAIAGVNTDDEPLPSFVHNLDQMLIQGPSQVPPVYFKGVPRSEGDVYVRLETPVIYFHAPAGYDHRLNVDVEFHGGWLTQYFPAAQVDAPGLRDGHFRFGTLTDQTVGKLGWHNLQLGAGRQAPLTTDPVWVAPRRVDASDVTAENGESERYLFYRGVGHVKTPLRVSRTKDNHLAIRADFGSSKAPTGPLWLVDVRPDGKRAVRLVAKLSAASSEGKSPPLVDATFADSDYSTDLTLLRRTMKQALVGAGLYEDEAEALLNTWEVSYFKRPGLRLFYLVPPEWTQRVLPLHVSELDPEGQATPLSVRRVMVGRVELVTPGQRQLMRRIAHGPVSDPGWMSEALTALGGGREDVYREEWYKKIMDGQQPLLGLHVRIPDDYRAYLELGRFRNALIVDEQARRPTPGLKAFIAAYGLEPSGS